MVRREEIKIPLLLSQLKRAMARVEQAKKGLFTWDNFLFPQGAPEAPLKKPKHLVKALKEGLAHAPTNKLFDEVREAQFALDYYLGLARAEGQKVKRAAQILESYLETRSSSAPTEHPLSHLPSERAPVLHSSNEGQLPSESDVDKVID